MSKGLFFILLIFFYDILRCFYKVLILIGIYRFDIFKVSFIYLKGSKKIAIAFALVVAIIGNTTQMSFGQVDESRLFMINGVASGDVTDNSAIIWARANREAQMHVQYTNNSAFSNSDLQKNIPVNDSTDFTGHIKLSGLNSNNVYHYRAWFSTQNGSGVSIISKPLEGNFSTAPSSSTSKSVKFVIGGDLGGSMYCRRPDIGYSIFSVMKALSPDFFLFNGDQIYADYTCPEKVQQQSSSLRLPRFPGWTNVPGDFADVNSTTNVNWTDKQELRRIYVNHWEYNRNDTHLLSLLKNTSMYSQADDHEVINDYGNWSYYIDKNREGFPNVVKAGIDAFFNFSPIDRNQTDPNRIYRSFHWGKDMELFILDSHLYRSRNDLPDTPQNNKTLLGKEQLNWLEKNLQNSSATWKIVSTSVPVTLPSCFDKIRGCDNWATDGSTNKTFTRERSELFKFLDDNHIKNVIFVSTDVHLPAIIQIGEDPNRDGDQLILYELISGPLSTNTRDETNKLDPTINARYYHNYTETALFNFGVVRVEKGNDNKMHLLYDIVDSNGRTRPNSHLDVTPLVE